LSKSILLNRLLVAGGVAGGVLTITRSPVFDLAVIAPDVDD
jgi:hypothetical protein